MDAPSAAILNSLKYLSNFDDELLLISPTILEPIIQLKEKTLKNKHIPLDCEEILIALSITAATNPMAEVALSKLSQLEGVQAHSTHILGRNDEQYLRKLGIDVTSDYTNVYNLKIPNREIRSYFGSLFLNRFFGTEVKTNILIKALEGGDIKKFEETLGEIMINMLSHFDLDKEMEKIYQVFMIGLVGFLMGKYEIISNDESGYGRYDLAMIPIKSNEKAYLMEFKISKTKKGMEESAEKALKQIDEKKYDTKLKARGIKNILKTIILIRRAEKMKTVSIIQHFMMPIYRAFTMARYRILILRS